MSEVATGLAVNVAVMDAARVLLVKREDFEVWCLPGGAVDPGESFGEAAIREVREETGLVVQLDRLVGLYSRPRMGDYHSLAVFSAHRVGGETQANPDEVIDLGWFTHDTLPEELLWGQRERITDVFEGVGGSVVRTRNGARPEGWPRFRADQYRLRDESGLSRAAFYETVAANFGPDESKAETPP